MTDSVVGKLVIWPSLYLIVDVDGDLRAVTILDCYTGSLLRVIFVVYLVGV